MTSTKVEYVQYSVQLVLLAHTEKLRNTELNVDRTSIRNSISVVSIFFFFFLISKFDLKQPALIICWYIFSEILTGKDCYASGLLPFRARDFDHNVLRISKDNCLQKELINRGFFYN